MKPVRTNIVPSGADWKIIDEDGHTLTIVKRLQCGRWGTFNQDGSRSGIEVFRTVQLAFQFYKDME